MGKSRGFKDGREGVSCGECRFWVFRGSGGCIWDQKGFGKQGLALRRIWIALDIDNGQQLEHNLCDSGRILLHGGGLLCNRASVYSVTLDKVLSRDQSQRVLQEKILISG
ncbi:hypothetical protein MRB53_040846 [Persea americana]|nr:hypothetical protein MRB53_040846 [Persea americana]